MRSAIALYLTATFTVVYKCDELKRAAVECDERWPGILSCKSNSFSDDNASDIGDIPSLSRVDLASIHTLQFSDMKWLHTSKFACNVTSLANLQISDCGKTRIRDKCLSNLVNLTAIYAQYNEIAELQDGVFNGLLHLKLIEVSSNKMERIGRECLKNLSSLTEFRARYNQLSALEDGLFNALPDLKFIDVSNNMITSIGSRCLKNLPSLFEFNAAYNRLTALQDGVFNGLNSLERIDLSHNLIASIGSKVFVRFLVPNLERIDLSSNRLRSIEPWPLIYGLFNPLASFYVDLSGNDISSFTNNLHWSYHCNTTSGSGLNNTGQYEYRYIRIDISLNKIRHYSDVISGWNMTIFHPSCSYSNSFSIMLDHNEYLECDCQDYECYANAQAAVQTQIFALFGTSKCAKPDRMLGKFPDEAPLDQFVCDVIKRCPVDCQCVYRPFNDELSVECSNAGLAALPVDLPPLTTATTRYSLRLSHNKQLKVIDERSLQYSIYDVKVLHVDDCSIERVVDSTWPLLMQIDTVFLNRNNLQSLPKHSTLTANVSTKHLRLDGNPWNCSCENSWMIDWAKSIEPILLQKSEVRCRWPEALEGKSLLALTQGDVCPTFALPSSVVAILSAAIALVLVVCVAIGVVALRHRRIELYARWNIHPFDRDECTGEDMDYDVFLCCSSEDHAAYGSQVLESLTSRGYKVSYDDDFGRLMLNAIQSSVQRSKRTVCLLTENFLNSSLCVIQFNLAFQHWLTTVRKNRVIVVMMLDDPSASLATGNAEDASSADLEPLRQYVREYTYIDFKVRDWLDRLLYYLPTEGMLRNDVDRNSDHVLLQPSAEDDTSLLLSS